MSVKLTGLTLKELKILRSRIDAAVQKLEANNLSKARLEAVKLAKEYGIPLEALIAEQAATKPAHKTTKRKTTKRSGKIVPPKYRHPDDASLAWTGRGLKPKWIALLLENGIKLEDLEIK